MVLNRVGFSQPACVQNVPCDVHNEHPILCRTYREPYYYGLMEDVEVIPLNFNPKDELSYKHLITGGHLFMPFLGPTCRF